MMEKQAGINNGRTGTDYPFSLLTTKGCGPQLEVHIKVALNVWITTRRIIETFLQCIPYTGFPKVLNAVFVAKKYL